jgi:hypothetical protein
MFLPEKLTIVQPLRKSTAFLKNPKVHHRVHKSPPLVSVLSQFDPVPCPDSMARPQVADGGNGLQIWRVSENILNKQSRTADKGVVV